MKSYELSKQNSKEFIDSWILDCISEEQDSVDLLREAVFSSNEGQPDASAVEDPKEFDYLVEPGQIRLITDTLSPLPQYGLVWKKDSQTAYSVIPFSRFDEPATDGEIKLEGDGGGMFLNVLQVWNRQLIHVEQLQRGWIVTYAARKLMDEVASVLNHLEKNCDIPEELLGRVGVPIRKETDIRRDYLEESRFYFHDLAEKTNLFTRKMQSFVQSLADRKKNLEFPALFPEFGLQAAAGEDSKSQIFEIPGGDKQILDILSSSEPLKHSGLYAQCQNPENLSFLRSVNWELSDYSGKGGIAYFVHRRTLNLIGIGFIKRDGEITLRYYVDELSQARSNTKCSDIVILIK